VLIEFAGEMYCHRRIGAYAREKNKNKKSLINLKINKLKSYRKYPTK
jgi:hypothetical protein